MGLEPKRLGGAVGVLGRAAGPVQSTDRGFAHAAPSKSCVDTIYRQEAPALRLFVKRMVRNRCDAEDLVQETFLRSWPALLTGSISCPRAFLFRTARNLALNHIRNGRVRNSDAARAASDDAFKSHNPTAEEQMIAAEEAAACQRLLDELPNRCREALVLRVVEDLSYKQMSKSMHLSVSTVEKHIGKGKQICRVLLTNPLRTDSALEILSSRIPLAQRARRESQRAMRVAAE